MTHRSRHARIAPALVPGWPLSRRRFLAAGAGLALTGAVLPQALVAQSDERSSRGHHPSPATAPDATGPVSLTSLLAFVPQTLIESSAEGGIHWSYADFARQFEALGIPHGADVPGEENADWLPAITPLAATSAAFQFARVEEFIDAIGFQPLGVDQSLLAGSPPEQLTLFRGTFEASRLESAWEGAGYSPETTAGGRPFWTLGTDGDIDLQHPVQRVVIAAFNNLMLVEDDLLLCAPTQDLLERALAAAYGSADAAARSAFYTSSLATLPEFTVSAVSVSPPGVGFSASTTGEIAGEFNELIVQSDAAVGPMPRFDGLITALDAGAMASEDGDSAGTAMVRIVTSSPADAEQVLAVVEYRWTEGVSIRTEAPYSDLMEITGLSVVGNVAMIDFEQLRSPSVWRDMIYSRDTLPFIPGEDS